MRIKIYLYKQVFKSALFVKYTLIEYYIETLDFILKKMVNRIVAF